VFFRYIHTDGVVRNYDRKEASGAKILSQVDKGRLSKEMYIMHENIIVTDQKPEQLFILTNKRVVYIISQTVMGGWSSEWEFEYQQMSVPTLEKENNKWCIIIAPQDEKKSVLGGLFSKSSGKKVYLPEGSTKESAQFMARMINDLKTCQGNVEPVIMKMILQKTK